MGATLRPLLVYLQLLLELASPEGLHTNVRVLMEIDAQLLSLLHNLKTLAIHRMEIVEEQVVLA